MGSMLARGGRVWTAPRHPYQVGSIGFVCCKPGLHCLVGQDAGDGAGIPEAEGAFDGQAAADLAQVQFFTTAFARDALAVEVGGNAGPARPARPRPGHAQDPFLFLGVRHEFPDGFAGFVDGAIRT